MQYGRILGTLRSRVGQPNSFVAAYILWKFGLPGVADYVDLVGADDVPYEAWPAAWKPLSAAIKRFGAPREAKAEAAALAEAETLVGYGFGAVDWHAEREHRTDPESMCAKFPAGDVAAALLQLYSEAVDINKLNRFSREQFWARRWFWLAGGSEAGSKLQLGSGAFRSDYKGLGGRTYRHTHRSAGEERSLAYLEALLEREPAVHAAASEKVNERGKVRALYAGDPASYYVTAAALMPLEDAWDHDQAIIVPGSAAELHLIAQRRAALKDGVGMMYDYSDFNVMHTLESLSACFSAAKPLASRLGPEWAACLEWSAKSALNQTATLPTHVTFRTKNGLFSGWRATTWCNTVLNWAYVTCAVEGALKASGARLLHRQHVGDDVFSVADSWTSAVAVYDALQNAGCTAQASKVLFSESAAEFLRVRYDDRGVRGYPARVICGLVGGDPNASEATTPYERIGNIADAAARATARGVDTQLAWHLFKVLSDYWGAAIDPATGEVVPPPESVLHVPRQGGGAGVFWDGLLAAKWVHTHLPARPNTLSRPVAAAGVPSRATDDAVRLVTQTLPVEWISRLSGFRDALVNASYTRPLGKFLAKVDAPRVHAELAGWYRECAKVRPASRPSASRSAPVGDRGHVLADVARALAGDEPARPRIYGAVAKIPGAAMALSDRMWHTAAGVRAVLSAARPRLVHDFDMLTARIGGEAAACEAWGGATSGYCGIERCSPLVRDYASLVRSTRRVARLIAAPPPYCRDDAVGEYIFADGVRKTSMAELPLIGIVCA
jgi:hypothetical protein